ncbi:MAG TPA: type II secretion system F family protein, partial [Actinomycetota bacterium]
MSEIWLFLAVGCLFLAIVLIGVFIDQQQAEKRRAVRMLETQVAGPAGQSTQTVDLREQEMNENFGTRVMVPVVSRAGRIAKKVTPLDTRDRIAKKLVLAGQPVGWDAERVLAFKVIGAAVGFVGSIIVLRLIDLSPLLQIVVIGLLTFVGFILPDSILSSRVEDRKKEVLRTLSDTLDLLTISVEAGLSLNAAMAQVVKNVPGVLSSEFARMLQEIQLGVPRSEAFRHLAERTDVEELNGFALAMIQADIFGVSIASVLRTQAQQLRI